MEMRAGTRPCQWNPGGSGRSRWLVVLVWQRDREVGQNLVATRAIPELLLRVKPPDMARHRREGARPRMVNERDKSSAVAVVGHLLPFLWHRHSAGGTFLTRLRVGRRVESGLRGGLSLPGMLDAPWL